MSWYTGMDDPVSPGMEAIDMDDPVSPGGETIDMPPLFDKECLKQDLLSPPLNYQSFQERFPREAGSDSTFVSVRPILLSGFRPRKAPRGGAPSVYLRVWCQSGASDEAAAPRGAGPMMRTRRSSVDRRGGCAFDGDSLLLEATGPEARVLVTLHDDSCGDGGDEAASLSGAAELPTFASGCLVDRFPLLDAKTGTPTGAKLTCAVKRIASYIPPPIYQHVLDVYEHRPPPFWGPILHQDEPWAPLGVGLGAVHRGVTDDRGLLAGDRLPLDVVWPRAAGPGSVLVSDWTIFNPSFHGDDEGWTYSESFDSPETSQLDFYGATVRCRRFYRHAADDARVVDVTKDDLPPYVLYDHVVRVHRQPARGGDGGDGPAGEEAAAAAARRAAEDPALKSASATDLSGFVLDLVSWAGAPAADADSVAQGTRIDRIESLGELEGPSSKPRRQASSLTSDFLKDALTGDRAPPNPNPNKPPMRHTRVQNPPSFLEGAVGCLYC